MNNMSIIEDCYQKYIKNIKNWLPEGIIEVDLCLLHKLDLLHYHDPQRRDPRLTRYFQVLESNEKITLMNEHFVVWIIPDKIGQSAITYTLIALNPNQPHLELGYSTSGVYNSSRLVLRVLEKFLEEIQENEDFLASLHKAM